MIPDVYKKLGVRPVIHGSGTTTRYGGSRLRPEALEAMRQASTVLVNIDELNEAAGAAIARMLGAEAAFVTAGASSGLILQAAACIAGDDPAKITRLPDTRGMRNEIVIQRAHRFAYDQAYRVAGGVLVEIGLARRTQPFELEDAITEKTAAVASPDLAVHEPAGRAHPGAGRRDRPPPRRAGHRRRGVDAAAAREPDQVPPARRRPRELQRRQGHPRAAVHRHPRGSARSRARGLAQREPQPGAGARREDVEGRDLRPGHGARAVHRRGRGRGDEALHRRVHDHRREALRTSPACAAWSSTIRSTA